MSHCHDEHHGHGHEGHDHSEGAAHDHTDDLTPALQYSLYQHIDFDNITTYNEENEGSGKAVIKKTWAERMTQEPVLESTKVEKDEEDSDSDDEDEDAGKLLIRVPFTGQVRLHSIMIRTSTSSDAPKTLRLFINKDDLDCSSANDRKDAPQEIEVPQANDVQEIPVKRALFSRVQSLSLFIKDNYSVEDGKCKEQTKISYLGFKGDWMALGKAPTNILYEAAANPNDHKIKGTSVNQMGSRLG